MICENRIGPFFHYWSCAWYNLIVVIIKELSACFVRFQKNLEFVKKKPIFWKKFSLSSKKTKRFMLIVWFFWTNLDHCGWIGMLTDMITLICKNYLFSNYFLLFLFANAPIYFLFLLHLPYISDSNGNGLKIRHSLHAFFEFILFLLFAIFCNSLLIIL